ncbi:SdpI family protein [Proteiniborus sp.]|uniref:SdpI family protein n=1 Tax=Proteiniborus sp. TaxID=2079015 RepID=UPI003332163F
MKKVYKFVYMTLLLIPIISYFLVKNKLSHDVFSNDLLTFMKIFVISGFCSVVLVNIISVVYRKKAYQHILYIKYLQWFTLITYVFINLIVVFFTGMLGEAILQKIIYFNVGLIIAIFGVIFPRLKYNEVLGFKSTWALKDEIVWEKVHNFSAYTWFLGGLMFMAILFVESKKMFATLLVIAFLLIIPIPYLYSFIVYKKEHK